MSATQPSSEIEKKYNVEHKTGGYNANGTIKPGGNKLVDLVGYSSVTSGTQGFYQNRTGTSNGIQLFDPDIMAMKEPFRTGRFILKIMKYPPFFPALACEVARWLFEDNARAVDGVPQNSISTIDIEVGATQRSISYPGMYKESGKDLTIKTPEWKGRPLGKFIEWWLGALSDRETGIGHLWGRDMNYVRPNYGMTFLYIILGPQARPEDIEFSCLWHDCFPTQEITSYMSSNTLGDVGSTGDQDVGLTGIYQTGVEVDLLAQIVTAQTGLYNESYLDMILPSYFYKGILGSTVDELESTKSSISINNIDRLRITQEQGINGYDSDLMTKIDEIRLRAYGDISTAENNPKHEYPYSQAIERAVEWDVNDRASLTPPSTTN